MANVEVITTNYRYELKYPKLIREEAYDEVMRSIQDDAPIQDSTQIIKLMDSNDVKSIRSYDTEDSAVEVEPPEEDSDVKDGMYTFSAQGFEFLGQKVNLEGLTYIDEGHVYYLLTSINAVTAQEAMGTKNLVKLMQAYAEYKGLPKEFYTAVIPSNPLPDFEEAEHYLLDYVEEVRKKKGYQPKEKNAKAYTGWNKDE